MRLARLHERRAAQHHRRAPRVVVAGARRAGQQGGLSEIEAALRDQQLALQDLGFGPQIVGALAIKDAVKLGQRLRGPSGLGEIARTFEP